MDQIAHARTIAVAQPRLYSGPGWLPRTAKPSPPPVTRDDAQRAFDTASHLSPPTPPTTLPFLFLGDSHLDRWRGNALARVGDTEAIDQLTDALARLPALWARARAALLVDLAHAHAAAGDRDAALIYARGSPPRPQIHSDRHLRRLAARPAHSGRPA